eukprot:Gb_33594 [translate_table: standard]
MAPKAVEFLKGKNILVTGSTGFLGKILMEKILRAQPGIGRIFVLIRAEDVQSAKIRLKNEVWRKELFKTLKEQHGANFENFVSTKVVPVIGDVTLEKLGIEESVREHLVETLDVIVNNAANTVFDERYDVALNVNTKGAKNVMEFAQLCPRLEILLHVSTAYVIGRKSGKIMERPLQMGEAAIQDGNTTPNLTLDIEAEFELLEKTLHQIETQKNVPEETKAHRLKELGLQRAKTFGWPNTYTFTKAMGDMIVGHLRGNLPLVIVRPSIIESTFAEPFPGWMEGTRTIDTLILGYGKGRISSFLADPDLILDVVLGLINQVLCKTLTGRYNRLLRKYNFVMYLAELYEPYAFFEGRFDNENTENMLKRLSTEDMKAFYFDVKCIDWTHYFLDIHIPGLVKYVLK